MTSNVVPLYQWKIKLNAMLVVGNLRGEVGDTVILTANNKLIIQKQEHKR